MIGVNVTFQYDGNFDHARVVTVAENARAMFEGMPGLRFKFFTFDEAHQTGNELLRLGLEGGSRELLHRRAARAGDRPLWGTTHH